VWWRTPVNLALTAVTFFLARYKMRERKKWALMEDDPPLWVLAVCTIS
jgi:hypothetical protein